MKLEKIKKDSAKKIDSLEMPESIRTPGRTWTRYPEEVIDIEDIEQVEPDVEAEGDVEFFTGEEAFEKAGKKFFDLIKSDENKLNAVHAANINALIYAEVSGEAELHIQYENDGPVLSHLIVDAKDNADLTVTEETESEEFNSSFTEIYVGENASVEYGVVEKPGNFSYSRRKAITQKYGKINWLNGMFTGDLNRTKIETVLKGDNSETEQTGVWYPTREQHHDISLHVRHIGDNTKCDMDSRSVVDHKARSLYEGLQKVEEKAVDTSSFQDQETLMLSDKAESDASPKLMIEDPNVEASHAAAAGTIEKAKQHYLESRGLNNEQAERLVVKGFFEPVMREIEVPRVKNSIREEVERKLDEKRSE
ncbi:SufD family Fe-S cluster assembly protein [Candidatus Nanohalobium constans]|uniref:Fe-S cluster assembly protein SufD n=1 Tax=Candidatus Nanohalobium constans TaxID=2565781 RepID=A0A5Q0UGT7_9ARCH|nr:SufD family Fe-S cluster assembly protein [Candidatus Nanohalobium constans]QGA80165.1 Fe-S cluster assembly protein SufD [Candidatus Nanohalobium constans]